MCASHHHLFNRLNFALLDVDHDESQLGRVVTKKAAVSVDAVHLEPEKASCSAIPSLVGMDEIARLSAGCVALFRAGGGIPKIELDHGGNGNQPMNMADCHNSGISPLVFEAFFQRRHDVCFSLFGIFGPAGDLPFRGAVPEVEAEQELSAVLDDDTGRICAIGDFQFTADNVAHKVAVTVQFLFVISDESTDTLIGNGLEGFDCGVGLLQRNGVFVAFGFVAGIFGRNSLNPIAHVGPIDVWVALDVGNQLTNALCVLRYRTFV